MSLNCRGQNTLATYQEAFEKSLEYYNGADLPAKTFVDKYALRDNEGNFLELTPDDMHRRLAKEFARIENQYPNPSSEEEIYNSLKDFSEIVPQGSPMSAIGNPYQVMSISNCIVVPSPEDSMYSIMDTGKTLAQLFKRRCGVGLSLSNLRPDGARVNNAARTTTGAWSFADYYSYVCRMVGQCVHENSRVLTGRGLVPIKDITTKDSVWTKIGWVPVDKKIFSGKKEVYTLTDEFGFEIKASADHIFLTEEDGELIEKRLGDFKPGDTVVTIPGTAERLGPNLASLSLKFAGYERKRTGGNSSSLNTDVTFPSSMDEELAYLVGYSYGDGCVEYDKFDEPVALSLAASNDWPEVKNKLIKIVKDKFSYNTTESPGDGDLTKVGIGSKLILKFLQDNELLKETHDKLVFPEMIFNAPPNIQFAFLSGFFDADGQASGPKSGYKFYTVCKPFIDCIRIVLMSNGVLSRTHIEKAENTEKCKKDLYCLCVVGGFSQKGFLPFMCQSVKVVFCGHVSARDNILTPFKAKTFDIRTNKYNYVPDNSQYLSVRCYDKLRNEFVVCAGASSGRKRGALKQEFSGSSLPFVLVKSSVKSIVSSGAANTYDLVLPKEHVYFAEGFQVHNSGRRGALMITMDVRHPDIFQFVRMKRDLGKVTGANISVQLNDEFMLAVEKNIKFKLKWPVDSDNPKVVREIKARELWNELIDSAYKSAEPGLLMWDNIIRELPAHCYSDEGFKTECVNPSLRGTTRVLTNLGALPIKQLSENSFEGLKVRNIHGQWEDCRVFMSGQNKQLYKVEFTNGQEVYCTAEHKWPIFNTSGNIINPQTGKVIKKRTDELLRRDKFYFPQFETPINIPECKFSRLDGFVVGWNQGDGWISYHKNNKALQYGFVFSEEDVSSGVAKLVLEYTNSIAKRSSALRRDHDSEAFTYVTTDLGVRERMKALGACNKAEGVPLSIWEANHDFICGYIDGLFSADGSVEINKKGKLSASYILLSSAHELLVKGIQELLGFYGIKSNIQKTTKRATFPNGSSGIYTIFELKISGLFVRKFSNVFLLSHAGKQERIAKLCSLPVNRPGRKSSYANSRDYLVVKSVTKTDIFEDVYDITVFDASHTFALSCGITGNCGELPLGSFGSCRLNTLNLSTFVENKFTKEATFNFERFYKAVRLAQRLMDDIVDIELEQIEKIINMADSVGEVKLWKELYDRCLRGRRTGLGTFALGDTLAQLCLPYDSKEALEVAGSIYQALRNGAYEESVNLAKERGPFPIWNWGKEKDNPFLNRLPSKLLNRMKKVGRRNISILTNAPTGSVSIVAHNSSSGIEPVFRNFYTRRKKINEGDAAVRVDFIDELGDKWQEFNVFHRNVADWIKLNNPEWDGETVPELPKFFVSSDEIDWKKRVKLQGVIQLNLDHSIASTINLPKDVSKETIGKLYLQAWKDGLKGVTIYVDGSRSGVLVTNNNGGDKKGRPKNIKRTHAPKRPEVLPCDVYRGRVQGEPWTIIVGLLHGEPYELFGGPSKETAIPKSVKAGFLKKFKVNKNRNQYDLSYNHYNEEVLVKDVGNMFENKAYGTFTRVLSLSLRHGAPVQHLVEQLGKDQSEELNSLSSVLRRALKRYIADGTLASADKQGCERCGSHNLKYQEGCPICMECSYTKCK